MDTTIWLNEIENIKIGKDVIWFDSDKGNLILHIGYNEKSKEKAKEVLKDLKLVIEKYLNDNTTDLQVGYKC